MPRLQSGLAALVASFSLIGHATAQVSTSDDARKSMQAQNERAGVILDRGEKAHYPAKFDLSGLPHYQPRSKLSGWIRFHGNNYLVDGQLGEYWQKGFATFQPEIRLSYYLPTSAIAFAALYFDQADLVMSHKPSFYDLLAFQRIKGFDPIEFTTVTGSFDVAGWENSTVIQVNSANPIKGITMAQLDGVFGAAREGGWSGTNFRPDWKRGPEKNIRTWGQLGLTGEWADKPISVYGFNLRYNTATDFSDKVMSASDKWNENIHAYAHIVQPSGKRLIQSEQITNAVAHDHYGISFNRFRHEEPNVKNLPIAEKPDGPFIDHTLETVQDRTYPLYQQAYFYTSVRPGEKMNPLVKEFIRYVLSYEGQMDVMRDGKYLPLTAEVVREQLKKLGD